MRPLRLFTLFFLACLSLLIPIALYLDNTAVAVGSVFAAILTYLSMYLSDSRKVPLPHIVQASIAFSLFVHMGGAAFGLYAQVWYYDIVTHLLGSAVIGLIAYSLLSYRQDKGTMVLSPRAAALMVFFIVMAVGGIWEIAEWTMDAAFDTHTQPDTQDTMQDLVFDLLAGIFVSAMVEKEALRRQEARKRRAVAHQ